MKCLQAMLFSIFSLVFVLIVVQQATVKTTEHVAGVYLVDEISYLAASFVPDTSQQTSGVIILDSVKFTASNGADTVQSNDFPALRLKLVDGPSSCFVKRFVRTRSSFFENRVDTISVMTLPLDVFDRINTVR